MTGIEAGFRKLIGRHAALPTYNFLFNREEAKLNEYYVEVVFAWRISEKGKDNQGINYALIELLFLLNIVLFMDIIIATLKVIIEFKTKQMILQNLFILKKLCN